MLPINSTFFHRFHAHFSFLTNLLSLTTYHKFLLTSLCRCMTGSSMAMHHPLNPSKKRWIGLRSGEHILHLFVECHTTFYNIGSIDMLFNARSIYPPSLLPSYYSIMYNTSLSSPITNHTTPYHTVTYALSLTAKVSASPNSPPPWCRSVYRCCGLRSTQSRTSRQQVRTHTSNRNA